MRARSITIAVLLLAALSPLSAQTNLSYEALSHSSVAITFNGVSGATNYQLRYIPASSGTCTSGTGGTVFSNYEGSGNGTGYNRLDLVNLTPNTTYNVCVEAYVSGAWQPGPSEQITTLPLPGVHPALPIHPATFNYSEPDETQGTCGNSAASNYNQPGYCKIAEVPSGNSCSDLMGLINSALGNANQYGTEIDIPAGTTCLGRFQISVLRPDRIPYDPINGVSGNTITLSSSLSTYGLVNGSGVQFGPTTSTSGIYYDNEQWPGGLQQGRVYYIVNATTNSFQLAATPGGTPISITPATGTPSGSPYFVPFPSKNYHVVVRTSTPDSQIAPPGTRTSPAWLSKMVTLEKPITTSDVSNQTSDALFATSTANDMHFYVTNLDFIGINFETQPRTIYSADPVSDDSVMYTKPEDSNIVFHRCMFTIPNQRQNRLHAWMELYGTDVAIVDSYAQNMNYWHANYTWPGMNGTSINFSDTNSYAPAPTQISSTSFSIPVQTDYYGAASPARLASTLTLSWSGTPSGVTTPEIAVYFDMNGNLQIAAPNGLNVTASSGTVSYTSTSGNGWCAEGDPLMPEDSTYHRLAAAPLGCATLNSDGTISSLVKGVIFHGDDTEGSSFILGEFPGPFALVNNYIEGSGIVVFFDDTSASQLRGDYLIQRNYFKVNFQHMPVDGNSYAMTTPLASLSDHYSYGHRQPLEWKGGVRSWVDANIFDGGFTQDTHGCFIDFTPRALGNSTDFDFTNNTFEHGPDLCIFGTVIDPGGAYLSWPLARTRVYNNLAWDINGWLYSTTTGLGFANGSLSAHGEFSLNEDVILDHNTFDDIEGVNGLTFGASDAPMEGVQITNNIIPLTSRNFAQDDVGGGTWRVSGTNCGSLFNEAFINCAWSNVTIKGNLFLPVYNGSSYPLSGQVTQAAMEAYLPDYTNVNTFLAPVTDVPTTKGTIGWALDQYTSGAFDASGNYDGPTPNWHLISASAFNSASSKYIGATDKLQAGADMNALEMAQGKVTLVGANQITSTSANITYIMPEAGQCGTVDFSNSDSTLINSFTRVNGSGSTRVCNASLTGLTSRTLYYFRVNGEVEQPTGEFRTN